MKRRQVAAMLLIRLFIRLHETTTCSVHGPSLLMSIHSLSDLIMSEHNLRAHSQLGLQH